MSYVQRVIDDVAKKHANEPEFVQTVTEVFQTLYTGMGNASTVLIGQALGRGNKDLAYTYAIKVFKLTFYF